jgi:hypothetical protein
MMQQLLKNARRSTLVLAAGVLALAACLPAHAAEPASFQWVPDDVSFYGTMLRNGQQWEAMTKSNAWARLKSLPIVKQYTELAKGQLSDNPQMALVKQIMDQPENKELIQLLNNLTADEVFMIGGHNWGDLLELYNKVNTAQNLGPLQMIASGKADFTDNYGKLQNKALLTALANNSKLIKIPDLIIGFKTPDPKKAENQLKRLETLAGFLVGLSEPLKNKFKRVQIGSGTFLTLELDGSLIPWDQIPFDDLDLDKDQVKKLRGTLEKLTLHIHLGVSGDYVLLSLAGSPGLLGKLGGKGPKLGDREEFKPLAKYADKKLNSVGYTSKALRQSAQTDPRDLDAVVELTKALLEKVELDEKQKKKLIKDVAELMSEAKKSTPEVGASLSFAFSTDKGQEGYSIEYGKFAEKAKPLTLLNHLGGSPLIAGVFRSETDLESYKTMVKVITTIYDHADEIAKTKLEGDAKEHYLKVTKAALPLLKRLDEITRTLYLPAVADGQVGMVIDAKWKSKQWIKAAPRLPIEAPMLEFGLIVGVSDSEKLVKAMTAYGKLFEDAVDVVRELAPDGKVPEIKIPAPETVKKGGATLYYYPLPDHLGLDERVAPTAGVGPKVAVLTLSHQHADRLLASKPIQKKDTAFETDRPLLAATIFNWAGIVDALEPWAEVAIDMMPVEEQEKGDKDVEAPKKLTPKEIKAHMKTIVEVLKVYKGTTTATYIEDGKRVTHSVSIVRDLDK